MKLTLSQALRYKKKIIDKINHAQHNVVKYNSTLKDSIQECNVVANFTYRTTLVKYLNDVKLAIITKTLPIQDKILELAECKSTAAWLTTIPTSRGLKDDYSGNSIEYVAVYTEGELYSRIEELKDRIDTLQSEIDFYNNHNEIEIAEMPIIAY